MSDNDNILIAVGLFALYWWYTNPAVATGVTIPVQVAPVLQQAVTGVPNTVPANLIPGYQNDGGYLPQVPVSATNPTLITQASVQGGAGEVNQNASFDQNPDQVDPDMNLI